MPCTISGMKFALGLVIKNLSEGSMAATKPSVKAGAPEDNTISSMGHSRHRGERTIEGQRARDVKLRHDRRVIH